MLVRISYSVGFFFPLNSESSLFCLISWLRASFSDPSSRPGTGSGEMEIKFWIQDKWDSLVSYGKKTILVSHVAITEETWSVLESKCFKYWHTFPPSLCENKASRLHDQEGSREEALSFRDATLPKFLLPFSESDLQRISMS